MRAEIKKLKRELTGKEKKNKKPEETKAVETVEEKDEKVSAVDEYWKLKEKWVFI